MVGTCNRSVPVAWPTTLPAQDGLAFEFGEEVKGVRPLNAFAEEATLWMVWSVQNDGKNDG